METAEEEEGKGLFLLLFYFCFVKENNQQVKQYMVCIQESMSRVSLNYQMISLL